jgi:hypothetical protein
MSSSSSSASVSPPNVPAVSNLKKTVTTEDSLQSISPSASKATVLVLPSVGDVTKVSSDISQLDEKRITLKRQAQQDRLLHNSVTAESSSLLQPPSLQGPSDVAYDKNTQRRQPQHQEQVVKGGVGSVGGGGCGTGCEENLLQQFVRADDVLLRIFEFLESRSLIQTMFACSRFKQIAEQSATQRTSRLALERQLNNVMQLLRVQEQMEGVNWLDETGNSAGDRTDARRDITTDCHVRAPILLLGRCIVVTCTGDPEFNGVYHCTDCNANGFVFTKPRYPIQRLSRSKGTTAVLQQGPRHVEPQTQALQQQQQQQQPHQNQQQGQLQNQGGELNDGGPPQQQVARHGQEGVIIGQNVNHAPAGARIVNVHVVVNGARNEPQGQNNQQEGRNVQVVMDRADRQQQQGQETPLFVSENYNGRPTHLITNDSSEERKRTLRCIISKKYSGQQLLWYMCKEIATYETGDDRSLTPPVGEGQGGAAATAAATQQPQTTATDGQMHPTIGIREVYYYWAPLSVGAPSEVHNYPSTSSYLRAHGSNWFALSTVRGPSFSPPIVELLN